MLRIALLTLMIGCIAGCSINPLVLFEPARSLTTPQDALDFADPIMYAWFEKSEVRKQKPFRCEFADGKWIILGSAECTTCKDGRFVIVLQAEPAQLISVSSLKDRTVQQAR